METGLPVESYWKRGFITFMFQGIASDGRLFDVVWWDRLMPRVKPIMADCLPLC